LDDLKEHALIAGGLTTLQALFVIKDTKQANCGHRVFFDNPFYGAAVDVM
jgi:hypothetical protein